MSDTMWSGVPHKMTVGTDDEGFRDIAIDHPDNCQTVVGQYSLLWVCAVGEFVEFEGIPDEFYELPDGEYKVDYWLERFTNYDRVYEYKAGLEILKD